MIWDCVYLDLQCFWIDFVISLEVTQTIWNPPAIKISVEHLIHTRGQLNAYSGNAWPLSWTICLIKWKQGSLLFHLSQTKRFQPLQYLPFQFYPKLPNQGITNWTPKLLKVIWIESRILKYHLLKFVALKVIARLDQESNQEL